MKLKFWHILLIGALFLIVAYSSYMNSSEKTVNKTESVTAESLHPLMSEDYYKNQTEVFSSGKDGEILVVRGYPKSIHLDYTQGEDAVNVTVMLDKVMFNMTEENMTIHTIISSDDARNVTFSSDINLHPVEMRFLQGGDRSALISSKIITNVSSPEELNVNSWWSENDAQMRAAGTHHEMLMVRDDI
jgi:hypothetical protein